MSEVSTVTFHHVISVLKKKTGISINEMLKEVCLDENTLKRNKEIKSYKLSAIFRYCMEKTNNQNLSLDLGASISYQSLGILGYLLLNTKNLKEMIEKFNTYQKLISNHLKFNFFDEGEYYKFAIYINENKYIPVPSFHAEVHLTAILTILTQILGQKVIPEKTFFSYSKQNESDVFYSIFGENIFYKQEENAIFFDKKELDIPVENADHAMLAFFENQAESLLSEIQNSTTFNKVEKEILKNIGDKEITIDLIASNLGLSIRTLQNYLKSESKTFSLALSNIREKLSKHYLINTDLDNHTIAILLGYSEISSFYKAFKKWHGKTPKELKDDRKIKMN